MILLPFCPQCGRDTTPEKKFCRHCGASLVPPEIPQEFPAESRGPVPAAPAARHLPPIPKRVILAAAGIVILLLAAAVAYPLLTGSGTLPAGKRSATPVPTLTPAGLPTTGQHSWVVVVTEEMTPEPLKMPQTTLTVAATSTTKPINTPDDDYLTCAADEAPCKGNCTSFKTDSSNCGSCGRACATGEFCSNGNCMKACTAGKTSCPDGCYDLKTDPRHCGTCTNSCQLGLICADYTCRSPATPMPVPM